MKFDSIDGNRTDYIDYIFGHKAIYYSKLLRERLANEAMTKEELTGVETAFRSYFQLPTYAVHPPCAFNLFGVYKPDVTARRNATDYLMQVRDDVNGTSAMGSAELLLKFSNERLSCYYRDVFRPSLVDEHGGWDQYHVMLLYCPSQSDITCRHVEQHSNIRPSPFGTSKMIAAVAAGRGPISHQQGKEVKTKSKLKTSFKMELTLPTLVRLDAGQSSSPRKYIHTEFEATIFPSSTRGNKRLLRRNMSSLRSGSSPSAAAVAADAATYANASSTSSGDGGIDKVLFDDSSYSPTMAVCTVLPYAHTEMDHNMTAEHEVNKHILLQWVAYYKNLGFKVLIYDRGGHHDSAQLKALVRGSAKDRNRKTGGNGGGVTTDRHIHYNTYTVLDMLSTGCGDTHNHGHVDAAATACKRDTNRDAPSTLMGNKRTIADPAKQRYIADIDKVLTLTHCRHELNARWGITDVLVADFNEFLLCRPLHRASLTHRGQAQFLRTMIDALRARGKKYGLIHPRIPASSTLEVTGETPVECLSRSIRRNESIFSCYGRFQDVLDPPSKPSKTSQAPRADHGGNNLLYKSCYFGHYCPLTSHLQSANLGHQRREYDCGDMEYTELDAETQCSLIRLATEQSIFIEGKRFGKERTEAMRNMLNTSEVWRVATNFQPIDIDARMQELAIDNGVNSRRSHFFKRMDKNLWTAHFLMYCFPIAFFLLSFLSRFCVCANRKPTAYTRPAAAVTSATPRHSTSNNS
jgi:hypothetical protein